MYTVKGKPNRALLYNGVSVILSDDAVDVIYKEKKLPDHFQVIKDFDSESYEQRYGGNVVFDEEPVDLPSPQFKAADEDSFVEWLRELSPRDDTDNHSHLNRLEQELRFFQYKDTVPFLVSLRNLIEEFKQDGIVWTGRGSSCASYILYLMEVHDVNPIKYNIDFKEFSKEDMDDV